MPSWNETLKVKKKLKDELWVLMQLKRKEKQEKIQRISWDSLSLGPHPLFKRFFPLYYGIEKGSGEGGGGWWQRLGNREKKDFFFFFFFEPLVSILSSYLSGAVVCFSSLTDQPTSIDLLENFTREYHTQTMGAQRRASATWAPPCAFFSSWKATRFPQEPSFSKTGFRKENTLV